MKICVSISRGTFVSKRTSVSKGTTLDNKLKKIGLAETVVKSIVKAVNIGMLSKSKEANIQAKSVEQALDQGGVAGLKEQVGYLLMFLKQWTGDEAQFSKKVLNKWAFN